MATNNNENKEIEEPDKIGLATFFDFICAVFARIAYCDPPLQIFFLSAIFSDKGGIIPQSLLKKLAKVKNIKELNSDEMVFGLAKNADHFPTRVYNGRKYIDFIEYAKKINILIERTKESPYYHQKTDPNIRIISIADSNYGECFVTGIKYIPNFVFVAYRGTYSLKTAASYVKPESAIPLTIYGDTTMLKGMAKINFEIIHAVTNAMMYISLTFLKKKPIPALTGQSLGGAMATIFVYEYSQKIAKIPNIAKCLSSEAICSNFGTPRVLGKAASEHLCKTIVKGQVLFHRFSNHGDIFTSLPPKGLGFYHPCSNEEKDYRKLVARDCNGLAATDQMFITSDYNTPIDCTNKQADLFTRVRNLNTDITNHGSYLYVSFLNNDSKFGRPFSRTEIGRVHNTNEQFGLIHRDTEMRVVQMFGNGKDGIYKADFVDLVKLREQGDSVLHEDSKDTYSIFNILLRGNHNNNNNNNAIKVKFDKKTKLPILFSKQVADNKLSDVNNPAYINALKSVNGSPRTKKNIKKQFKEKFSKPKTRRMR